MPDQPVFEMTRIGWRIVAILLIASLLSTTVARSQDQPQTIIIWHPYTGEVETAFATLAETYNNQNPQNPRVETVSMGSRGQLFDQMILYLPNDQGENILPNAIVTRPDDVALFALSGRIVDLHSFVENGLPTSWLEGVSRIGQTINGQQYGWPLHLHTEVMIVNEDALAGLDATVPRTVEDWLETACAFRSAGGWSDGDLGEVWGATIPIRNTFFFGLLAANGINFTDDQPAFAINIDQPATTSFVERLQSAQENNCITTATNPGDALEAFVNGRTLFYLANTSELSAIRSGIEGAFVDPFAWEVYALPGNVQSHSIYTHGMVGAIIDHDPDANEAAWAFLRWISEPAQQAIWVQATGGLPTDPETAQELADSFASFPQWAQTWQLVLDSEHQTLPMLAGGDVVALEIEFVLERLLNAGIVATEMAQLDNRIAEVMQHFAY